MDQLKNLLDYTKFHIGLYATVVAAAITSLHMGESAQLNPLRAAIVCFLVAGAAGGIIAGSICNYSTWEAFTKAGLGPSSFSCLQKLRYGFWANLEHGAFW